MTTDQPPGGNPPPDQPPLGLLAATAKKVIESEGIQDEQPAVAPLHQLASVDPAYVEPSPPAAYREVIAMYKPDVDSATPTTARASIESLLRLAGKLVQRIEVLEGALRPLANHAPQVGNARMCLVANGRPGEPAAGIWVSGVQSIHMTPNESIFLNAADAYGRGRVEQHMVDAFERVRKAQEASNDKSVFIEGGGKLS